MRFSDSQRDALNTAKLHLRDYLIHIGLDPNKNMHCLHHHPDQHPSMSLLPDGTAVFCHACHWHADLPNVIAEVEHLQPNSKDAIDRAIAFAGLDRSVSAPRGSDKKQSSKKHSKSNWIPALQSKPAVDFLHSRGFQGDDKDIINQFGVSFDKKHHCLIIPHDGDYFTARTIGNVDKDARYCHNPSTSVTLFNGDAIQHEPIIAVCEGAIDALSLIACDLPAVALGGAGTQSKFMQAFKKATSKPHIIVAFDNDLAGRSASDKLIDKILQQYEVPVAKLDLKGADDVNDLFISDRATLRDSIKDAIKELAQFKHFLDAPALQLQSTSTPTAEKAMSPKDIARDMIRNRFDLPVKNAFNFNLIFYNDPAVKAIVAFNEFSNRIELKRCPPWRRSLQPGTPWQDIDDHALQNYIDQTYDLVSNSTFIRVLDEYAYQHSFHPVRDFFYHLPPWDGTLRAESLLIDNLGAADNPYMRAITKHWLLAAVSRIFHPGCKFDFCLVLKGSQGIGKSTLLRRLGGNWFGELNSIQGKDAVGDLQGLWLVELVEMQATKKADNEQIKAFLSTNKDRARLSYDRRTSEFPRQCVFAATTNEHEFLHDQTGGRRFWIAECNATSYAIRADLNVAQVWAEVFHLYNQLFADGFDEYLLDIPVELKPVATNLQFKNTDGSDLRGRIEAFLDRPIPNRSFWQLLSQEERRTFFKRGKVALPIARLENNKQTAEMCSSLRKFVSKDFDQNEYLPISSDTSNSELRFLIFDQDPRRHIVSPVELANELFYDDKLPVSNRRIADIMRTLDGWIPSTKRSHDAAYGKQNTVFERVTTQE